MSRTFVAVESSLGRRVVVKVLPADLSGQVSAERFKREISVAARLQHAHIVPLLTAGEVDGLPYFTMPYVEGESLRSRLTRNALRWVNRLSGAVLLVFGIIAIAVAIGAVIGQR